MNFIKINDIIYFKNLRDGFRRKTFLKQSGKAANKQTTSKIREEEEEREREREMSNSQ